MNSRQGALLKATVEEYVRTAAPVGSAFLAEDKHFNISPATIRKELVALEEEGYILQPHTSAGRVPTEKGFRYYVEHCLETSPFPKERMLEMAKAMGDAAGDHELLAKRLGRAVAELSQETVLIGFLPHHVYYTGISHLFAKPEFSDVARITSLSSVIDRFDDIVSRIWDTVEGVTISIGSECPFGNHCAAILAKSELRGEPILLALIGPMRMDYARNAALIEQTIELLRELAPKKEDATIEVKAETVEKHETKRS